MYIMIVSAHSFTAIKDGALGTVGELGTVGGGGGEYVVAEDDPPHQVRPSKTAIT